MVMAIPPFRHCEEIASTDVAISELRIGKKERLQRFALRVVDSQLQPFVPGFGSISCVCNIINTY
jgi:hypothetical protein